jgi:hypothetical protein
MKTSIFRIICALGLTLAFMFQNYSCTQRNKNGIESLQTDTLALINRIDSLKKIGFRMIDMHAHLKGGLTMNGLLEHAKKTGISYGVAANCGIGFPIKNDSGLMAYYYSLVPYPVFKGLQAEGREWINLFSPDSVKKFDYVFTDAMTFTDNKGRRMRLWMKDEVWVDDRQAFMEMLVEKITSIMASEPVDIYVNPTFLPDTISSEYDKLWTEERMNKVITAAVKNNIAIEINSRYKIPSATFIKKAKAAGVKFTMGTNNPAAELGFLEYCMDMINTCNLKPEDFWQVK